MTLKNCAGCRDNFYNGNNPLGVKRCWSFDEAKPLETRFKLSTNTPMNIRSAYLEVQVPPCYHESGYVHMKAVPDYAK